MSIDVNSTTINFNGANIKIASSGKGIIFADGTTLSSNTEIGGGGSSNLAQVVDLGNTTSNTLLLENTGRTIVSSGNIESNIITTIIRFQEGSELPDGQGITLESAANNGNTISNVVQFSNGFTVGSNLVVDEIGTNVIDVTGRIGATLFVGDGGLLSNISGGGGGGSADLQDVTENGNTTSEIVQFTNGLVSGNVLVTSTSASEIMLEADSGDTVETNNPIFKLRQDGRGIGADFGIDQYNSPYINFNATGASSSSANSFHINYIDSANTYLTVTKTGNVGIGTTSPSATLHIIGNVHTSSDITTTGHMEVLESGGSGGVLISEHGALEIFRGGGDAFIDFKNSYTDNYDFRLQVASSANALQFKPNGGVFTTIASDGSVGINKGFPSGRLHIKQTTDDSGGNLDNDDYASIFTERAGSTNKWGMGVNQNNNFLFWYNATLKAWISATGSNSTLLNFTGQHRCVLNDIYVSESVGLIVCADNNEYLDFNFSSNINVNESIPIVSLSTKQKDKSCFGVISGREDSDSRTFSSGSFMTNIDKETGDNRVFVNSVGEGAIWVSNLNGNLESGDYITTSNIAGYGQKQDSEFLANYTVAKITMDCDFNPRMVPKRIIQKDADGNNVLDSNGNLILIDSDEMISQYEVKTLDDGTMVAFVGCTYHCG